MKKILVVQISFLLIISGTLGGMFLFTDIYEEVQSSIVEILCLSCIKLNPKTSTEFTFETANGQPHPEFILNNLTKGPVFLQYSEDDCPACDIMFPVIKQFLNVEPEKDKSYYTLTTFENQTVPYFYIYLDDGETSEEWLNTFEIYDKDHVKGLPMFTVVSLGYEHSGEIKPYYTTAYGTLGLDEDEDRKELLTNIILDGIELYNENRPGFIPD